MTLAEWLARPRNSLRALSARMKRQGTSVHPTTLWRYANGRRVPNVAVAKGIEVATNGKVKVSSFAGGKA